MNKKKITSSALAALMIAGSTSFSALAAMPNGTVVIGDKAYDLAYANDPANVDEITAAIVAGGSVFVKDFAGSWMDNTTAGTVEASAIPAVTYKDAAGAETEYAAADDSEEGEATVKSIKALNLKQFKMEFNRAVTDEDMIDDIESTSNYELENKDEDAEVDDAIEKVEVDESGKFALITIADDAIGDEKVENQKDFILTIDEDVFGEEIVETFEIEDLELPEAISAEVVGKDTIKVIFSESVKPNEGTDMLKEESFEINDEDISIDEIRLFDNNREAHIKLSSELKDGDELEVKVKSEFEDYAGYSVKKSVFNIKVEQNKEELAIVGYEDAEDSKITLVFNKDIKFTDENPSDDDYLVTKDDAGDEDDDDYFLANFYHTNSHTMAEKVEIDGHKVILTFDAEEDALPDGTAYIYVDADSVEDLWEKKNNDLFIKVEVSADKEKPEIKSVEMGDEDNEITIKFSEEVKAGNDKGEAQRKANYEVLDADGDKVKVDSISLNSDADEVTLTMKDDLDSGDTYKVTVEDVEDIVGNKIAKTTKEFKATTQSYVAGDDIDVDLYSAGDDKDQKLVIDFDGTEMLTGKGTYAIDNLENYTLQILDSDGDVKEELNLSDYYKAKIKLVSGNTGVEIDIPGDKADDEDQFNLALKDSDDNPHGNLDAGDKAILVINRVEDTNGNKKERSYDAIEIAAGSKITIDDAPVATSPEEIVVSFEKEFDFKSKDIKLVLVDEDGDVVKDSDDENVVLKASTSKKKSGGVTKVTYSLEDNFDNDDVNSELNFDGTYTYKGTDYTVALLVVDNDSKNDYDSTFEVGDMWKVSDQIKPAFAKFEDEDGDNMKENHDAYDDREDYDDAVEVTAYDFATKKATIKMTFEEKIVGSLLNTRTFDLDDSDLDIVAVYTNPSDKTLGDSNVVYVDVNVTEWEPKSTDTAEDIFDGVEISTRNTIEDLAVDYDDDDKANHNETDALETTIDFENDGRDVTTTGAMN